ncbi:MAG: CHASE3 domain-containing protein [Syntrophobacterales bacterium]|jgi:signal transduction histidine kinase|nr:CHASE3 domain-containing protein [Syntrophobacterales bacterium]
MRRKIIAAWACLAVIFITVSYTVTYQNELQFNFDKTAHVQETLALIYDLQNNLSEAESVSRGYTITGDEDQLKLYAEAAREIDRIYQELDQISKEEPELQRFLAALNPLIKQRLTFLQQSIDLRRQHGFESQEIVVLSRKGMKARDNIRKLLHKMENAEKEQMVPQWAHERRQIRIRLWGLTIASFLSFSGLFLMLYFLSNEIKERRKAEGELVSHRENLRSLASQLTLAEERERRRIAVNLHDQIGQTLALSNIRIGELHKSLPPGSEALAGELDQISGLIEEAIRESKSLIFRISSPILHELGFAAAVDNLLEELPQQHGITTHFKADDQPVSLDDDIRILLFQAVSELLVNVVKHARARNVEVSMGRAGEQLRVTVADDGVGFKAVEIAPSRGNRRGFGLFSIRERLKPFGGVLEVQSDIGAGTKITLIVPLKPNA